MKPNPLALMTLLFFVACQPARNPENERTTVADSQTPNAITIGTVETINSAILGEGRDLWVYLPPGAQDESNVEIFPVVYLLDGDLLFHSVSGMIDHLSTFWGTMTLPEMIVVGITNPDRMRDLTPTHTGGNTGGGPALLDFIEQEVFPFVESQYPASRYRTLVGHSLGGLMVIEALVERPHLFTNYVAIDPGLWWDGQAILIKAEKALSELDFSGKSLFLTASRLRPGVTFEEALDDANEDTLWFRSIVQFVESASDTSASGLNFAYRYYEEDTHSSVPLISEYDAFRFLFSWHDPVPYFMDFGNPSTPDDPEAFIDFINSHFETISDHFGHTKVFPLSSSNSLVGGMRFMGKTESAFALAQLNVSNYQSSPVAHETLGDLYLSRGDEESAHTHYLHAIERGGEIDIDAKLAD